MDHRIAMSFLIAGTGAMKSVTIDDAAHIGTSFPGFTGLMNRLGANIFASDAG
jgi:3-phosphoshikimate 1-carboxyvinyltransferase